MTHDPQETPEPDVIGVLGAMPAPTLSEALVCIAQHIEMDATEEAVQEGAVLRQAAAKLIQPPDSELMAAYKHMKLKLSALQARVRELEQEGYVRVQRAQLEDFCKEYRYILKSMETHNIFYPGGKRSVEDMEAAIAKARGSQ